MNELVSYILTCSSTYVSMCIFLSFGQTPDSISLYCILIQSTHRHSYDFNNFHLLNPV